jgi:hypothetical protein
MGPGFSRCCTFALVVSACALFCAPALASSTPIGLTAVARSDHLVELSWAWPAGATYPDELDVWRDGLFFSTVARPDATSFADVNAGSPATSHTYELVPVDAGAEGTRTATTPAVTLRQDLPYKPTDVTASFVPGTSNIATVRWTRGDQDADVTYNVTAQQGSSGPVTISKAVKYADPGTDGSVTMDGFTSYTFYTFKVSAVEDVGDPAGDPGGTVAADLAAPPVRSFDVIAPQFAVGAVPSATRSGLGTIVATFPSATDAGSSVSGYTVCVDAMHCVPATVLPLEATQTATLTGLPNDGGSHTLSVVAADNAAPANASTPISSQFVMPLLAKPVIALEQGGNGCAPLVARVTSADGNGSPAPTFHLFADGVEIAQDTPITGAPYQAVSLGATATYNGDTSPSSDPIPGRVYDAEGPDAAPVVHGQAFPSTGSVLLTWSPVPDPAGAPIAKYVVTSDAIPGYEGGVQVLASPEPSALITNLAVNRPYPVQVSAVDACGRPGPASSFPSFRLDDTKPPTAPVLNVPSTTGHDVTLTWAPSTDDVAVDDYTIYVNGSPGPRTPNTTWTFSGLGNLQQFTYQVRASDGVGNLSALSVPQTAKTKDTTPPTFLSAINRVAVDGNVTLSWTAATDNGVVVGYVVRRDDQPVANGNVTGTTFVDKNVPAGKHRWDVMAYDAANNLSLPHSAELTTTAAPKATAAAKIRVVKSKGAKMVRVGGTSGARVVLSFKITQAYANAVLRLTVLKAVPTLAKKGSGSAKRKVTAKVKVRVSLPLRSGRTEAGKRLAERAARKGIISIPLGVQKPSTLRLVLTASGGVLTLSGGASGPKKAPTVGPAGSS